VSEVEERIVTIFGGSKCVESDLEYKQAMSVGALLADSGFTICTGGYAGVMEAASRGAHERGGRVLGITMNQFKSEPNRYLTEKVPSEHFYERLQRLITRSVGFIALRGGMGTVTEISLVWNKLQTGVLDPRPLVLLGDCWPPIVGKCNVISQSVIRTFRSWTSRIVLKKRWRSLKRNQRALWCNGSDRWKR
jgi:uncharacterized protein (TIGR00730 family)